MTVFRAVQPKQQFPALEETILQFWREHRIFETTLQDTSKPVFVFYEGPPTANGKPGIHHVLTRAFKDVIPRYKTMQGFRVPRRAGWDCHGLPVEVEVEKKLGLTGKPQIEQYGIAAFNQRCKESVLAYIKDWNQLTERIGFWLDAEHPYRTLDNEYIESCWALLHSLWQKDLLQKDYKVTKHCPRCGTSLAEAEASQGMKEKVDDPAITVKLQLLPNQLLPFDKAISTNKPISLLVWTTTPWTLPANVAAAVHADSLYALCQRTEEDESEWFVVLAHQAKKILGDRFHLIDEAPGHRLNQLKYKPLYQPLQLNGQTISTEEKQKAYHVVVDESVDPNEGTGIVHIAPAYGDLDVGRRHDLPIFFSVGLDGHMLPTENIWKGLFFKDADTSIIRDLKERNLLFHSARTQHSYPFCWRCDTPLLYFAKTSWYIRTTLKKQNMIDKNQDVHWIPEHIQEGRFGDWLRNNVDWAISRERYWGTPLPVWECSAGCGQQTWVESIASLSNYIGLDATKDADFDLHRPYVDNLTWKCKNPSCHGNMQRVKDVIDCWFDSGAMPYAQHHYPIENKQKFLQSFPADFICEGVDQTRGWFYTLHALAVLTQNQPAYKTCMALGHILDDQGRKMSKRLGNIVDPWTILNSEGADALRYYMYTASPPGQPRKFSQALVRQALRQFQLTLWNCYSFFTTYAEAEYNKLGTTHIPWHERPMIDQWILGKLHRLIEQTTSQLNEYEISNSLRNLSNFVDILSNWYIRRNRDRFWSSLGGPEGAIDQPLEKQKRAAYHTLHECLVGVSQLLAPFLPFLSEELWQNLVRSIDKTAAKSVHLSTWPKADNSLLQQTNSLVADMETVLTVVNLGRAARVEHNIKIRQPLSSVAIQTPSLGAKQSILRFAREIKEELNVENIDWVAPDAELVHYTVRPNLPKLGKKLGAQLKELQAIFTKASEKQVQQWAHMALTEQPIVVSLSGKIIELQPDEILLSSQSAEGFAAQASEGLVVALHTEITPELYARGVARELVRAIGELRKQAGCKVTDRIILGYYSEQEELMRTICAQKEWIANETLASVQPALLPNPTAQSEISLEEGVVVLSLVR